MPPLGIYIPVELDAGFKCALFRLESTRVMFQVKIDSTTGRKFDKYRMPVVWFDGKAEVDLCLAKSTDELMRSLDPGGSVHFSFEERDVSGVIWHGLVNEGTGAIGKLLKASNVSVRIYFDDYTIEDFLISSPRLAALKQSIMSDILRL